MLFAGLLPDEAGDDAQSDSRVGDYMEHKR